MDNKGSKASTIQWFPGHMTKAERMMSDSLKSVDLVCEIRDARIPYSSKNPDIDKICSGKPRIVILSREDLADQEATAAWVLNLRNAGIECFSTDARERTAGDKLLTAVRTVLKDKMQANMEKGMAGKPIRLMIAGIPNVGKSTVINSIAGRKAAIAANSPGVTRGKQWVSVGNGLQLLDTPGILWPKFDSLRVGRCLAITGAVKTDVFDVTELASVFLSYLCENYPEAVEQRYKICLNPAEDGYELLEKLARKRGMLVSGGDADTERMAATLLKEYRDGKLGRLTLETPGKNYDEL